MLAARQPDRRAGGQAGRQAGKRAGRLAGLNLGLLPWLQSMHACGERAAMQEITPNLPRPFAAACLVVNTRDNGGVGSASRAAASSWSPLGGGEGWQAPCAEEGGEGLVRHCANGSGGQGGGDTEQRGGHRHATAAGRLLQRQRPAPQLRQGACQSCWRAKIVGDQQLSANTPAPAAAAAAARNHASHGA
eukprot:358341-Chlamydomonas_euryale.AAC.2